MSNAVMLEILGLIVGRQALECYSDTFINKSTPGRLVSSAHGLFVLALLHYNNWQDAIESTALYFFFDILFTVKYMPIKEVFTFKTCSIIFHHFLGCLLCCFSTVTKSYQEFHLGSKITRALLMLEICNPLLHFSMILKNESPEIINIEFLSLAMDIVMLMNYFYMRVWTLGNSLWINTNDKIQIEFFTKYPISLFYLFSVLLWILQVTWFLYLAVGLYNKLLWPLQTRKEI
jgi:hypothetical protein